MGDVIQFSKHKADADKNLSEYVANISIYTNKITGQSWADIEDAPSEVSDGDWLNNFADCLRQIAWLCDGQAAEHRGNNSHPIAQVAIFEDSRISTRWNDGLVKTEAHVQWILGQLSTSVETIHRDLGHT